MMENKDLEELERLYNEAMAVKDTILAQTIAYLIAEKQKILSDKIIKFVLCG